MFSSGPLTVKLRGRVVASELSGGCILFSSTRGDTAAAYAAPSNDC